MLSVGSAPLCPRILQLDMKQVTNKGLYLGAVTTQRFDSVDVLKQLLIDNVIIDSPAGARHNLVGACNSFRGWLGLRRLADGETLQLLGIDAYSANCQ